MSTISVQNLAPTQKIGWTDGHAAKCVSTVSALGSLAAQRDGQVIELLGYYTAGDGGGQTLVYHSTGRPTADDGFYFDGPGADDYFEAVDQSEANLLRFGCYNDGTNGATTTARAQAAIDTGVAVRAPSGTYGITEQLTISTNGQRFYGDGGATVFVPTIDDGTYVFLMQTGVYQSIENLRIAPTTTTLNCGGIKCTTTKFRIRNVDIVMGLTTFSEAPGIFLSAAFIADVQAYVRGAAIGLKCTGGGGNDTNFNLHIENCGKPFELTSVGGARFDVMYESTVATTTTGTIDACEGITFSHLYLEQASVGPSVPFVTIGATTKCAGITISGLKAVNLLDENPIIALDKVDGVTLTGFMSKTPYRRYITTTANTKNLRYYNGTTGTTEEVQPLSMAMGPLINYMPDPFMLESYPGAEYAATACSVSEDTTIAAPWGLRSIKITPDADATANKYITRRLRFSNYPHLAQLAGKKVGVAAFVYLPDTDFFVDGVSTAQTDIQLTSDGSGAVASTAKNGKSTLRNGYSVILNEATIGTGGGSIWFEYYIARGNATVPDDTEDFAYLLGVLMWPGGLQNYEKAINGQFVNYPWSRIYIPVEVFAPTTNTATGDGKAYVAIPANLNGARLTAVQGNVVTAGTTGTTDIQLARVRSGTPADILTTKLTIDSGETGSDTATAYAISTTNNEMATGDVIRVDVDAVAGTPAIGLNLTLEFTK